MCREVTSGRAKIRGPSYSERKPPPKLPAFIAIMPTAPSAQRTWLSWDARWNDGEPEEVVIRRDRVERFRRAPDKVSAWIREVCHTVGVSGSVPVTEDPRAAHVGLPGGASCLICGERVSGQKRCNHEEATFLDGMPQARNPFLPRSSRSANTVLRERGRNEHTHNADRVGVCDVTPVPPIQMTASTAEPNRKG